MAEQSQFQCLIHGSFSKHFEEIKRIHQLFTAAGITVLAPQGTEIAAFEDGFALFAGEQGQDPRLIELMYLHNLKKLDPARGFSYFVCPEGYIGTSASYELGIAQLTNTRCFFSHQLNDHPAYLHQNSVWSAEALADHIATRQTLPRPLVRRDEKQMHQLWVDLMVPGSVVATGAIIEYRPRRQRRDAEHEVLLVRTHKWGDRFSIVGGGVRRRERLDHALLREVREETQLRGEIGAHICTFDQIENSGYYQSGVQHIFVDNVVNVTTKRVVLNHEAEDFVWVRPTDALRQLDIEPNARATLGLYQRQRQLSSSVI